MINKTFKRELNKTGFKNQTTFDFTGTKENITNYKVYKKKKVLCKNCNSLKTLYVINTKIYYCNSLFFYLIETEFRIKCPFYKIKNSKLLI